MITKKDFEPSTYPHNCDICGGNIGIDEVQYYRRQSHQLDEVPLEGGILFICSKCYKNQPYRLLSTLSA